MSRLTVLLAPLHHLYLEDWGSEWQGTYTFARSVPRPSGTRIDVEAVYDHSPGNRRNSSAPPGDVNRGEGTIDETCIASVRVTTDAEQPGYRPLTRGHLSEETRREDRCPAFRRRGQLPPRASRTRLRRRVLA